MGDPCPISNVSQELPIRLSHHDEHEVHQQDLTSQEGQTDSKPVDSDHHPLHADYAPEEQETTPIEWVEPKKKKKRKTKPKSKRGKNKPTGFEEYYVDPPITPEEYEKERDIYDISRPIIHRMEDAILRFEKNRRLESDRREVFLKYLQYGGVDISPKMFTGVDDRELQEMDSEQILLARAQTSIGHDRLNLLIDFNTVVKGYLTSYFPYYFNPESEDMVKLATVTIRNFLSYLLYHDVCPEYKENIDEARKSCDIATKDLWKNQQLTAQGPGDFNTACSTLFGGFLYDMYVEDNQWVNTKDNTVRMTNEIARKVVKFALAGAGSEEQAIRFQELAKQNALRAMQVEDIHGFEIIAVIPPDPENIEFSQTHASDLHPIGRLIGKAYRDPGKPRFDLSPEESLEWEHGPTLLPEFEFFLEESLLRHCYPGMKVMTSVWELNCGFHYFEDVFTAYCSNYTVLANDLMLGWKKPRDLTGGEDADESGEDEGEGVNDKVPAKVAEEVL